MLKLQHLTKRFGAAPLFTDLCMEVDAPVVLWAPSGWGKTTLLRILMGLERPTTALQLPARRLSGGQKRRVALLRALWAPSDTLLLDEPFTGMDPDTLQRAAALLRQRCAGKPVLLATHDKSAIRALGWPVVELKKLGRS